MPRYASPLVGKTIDWRAGCGRSARPVRREGGSNPIGSPYPYQEFQSFALGPRLRGDDEFASPPDFLTASFAGMTVQLAADGLSVCSGVFLHPVRDSNRYIICRFNVSQVLVIIFVTLNWRR